jgi:hypothetical protein
LPPITHFAYRIDCWDDDGENIIENLAGVEHFTVAKATYRAAQLGNIARAVPSVLALHRWSWIGEPNASLRYRRKYYADAPHALGLLRESLQRPRNRRAAEQRDEVAALHSITSSARC